MEEQHAMKVIARIRSDFTEKFGIPRQSGLVDNLKDPGKIETALRAILPPEQSSDFCHRLVLHGRAVCDARKPQCALCCVRHVCQTREQEESE